jgi:hypothetical protein
MTCKGTAETFPLTLTLSPKGEREKKSHGQTLHEVFPLSPRLSGGEGWGDFIMIGSMLYL